MRKVKLFLLMFVAMSALCQPSMARSNSSSEQTEEQSSDDKDLIDWLRILGETAQGGNRSVFMPFDGSVLQNQVVLSSNGVYQDVTVEIVSPDGSIVYAATANFVSGDVHFISLNGLTRGTYEIYIMQPCGIYMYGKFSL